MLRSQPRIGDTEDLQGWDQITVPVANGGLGFSTQWNESLCYALRNAVIPASDAARLIQPIVDALNVLSGPNAFKYVVYTENHDKDDPTSPILGRLPDLIHPGLSNSWESKNRSTLAAAVVMTAPAIPMISKGRSSWRGSRFPTAVMYSRRRSAGRWRRPSPASPAFTAT